MEEPLGENMQTAQVESQLMTMHQNESNVETVLEMAPTSRETLRKPIETVVIG